MQQTTGISKGPDRTGFKCIDLHGKMLTANKIPHFHFINEVLIN